MADGLVQQNARPARTEHDRKLSGRRGDRAEIGDCLGKRDIDGPAPFGLVKQAVIEMASAEAMVAGFAAIAILGDDLHAETHQRPDIIGDEAVGANDVDDAPAGRQ